MNAASPLGESEFHERVESVMASIEAQLEDCDDLDFETNGGILTIQFADGGKVIINRQTPNREIWVAAKSGGFHFRFDGTGWLDTRSGEPLAALLSRVVSAQAGAAIAITI